jgi:predicted ABC-type ATPase
MKKTCYIINEILHIEVASLNLINAGLILKGLSSFQPDKAAMASGRIMIQQVNDCVNGENRSRLEQPLKWLKMPSDQPSDDPVTEHQGV